MFLSADDLRQSLQDTLPPAAIAALIPNIQPVLLLMSTGSSPSRLGGTPDMAANAPWPQRMPPSDLAAELARWDSVAQVQRLLPQTRPMTFAAQIDLTQTAALGGLAADLPSTGRLLFFLDMQLGAWEEGTQACAVIHDQTPVDQLIRTPAPQALIDLDLAEEAAHVADFAANSDPATLDARVEAEVAEMQKTMAEIMPDMPFDAAETREVLRTAYSQPIRYISELLVPEQPVALQIGGMLPDYFNIEHDAMVVQLASGGWSGMTEAARAERLDALSDLPYERPAGCLAHLLGLPIPDQDDPRYGPDGDAASAADQRLLLQLPVSAFLADDLSEGQFYFLIPNAALAARDFTQTYLVYQQT